MRVNANRVLLLLAGMGVLLWLGAAASVRAQNRAYLFHTIAGLAGQPGSADGTNSDARFRYPANLALDQAGNIFVADNQNHTIRKITAVGTNWVVSTIAGVAGQFGSDDGTNNSALFHLPNGLAVDPGGVLYVVDHYNHTIRKVSPVGTNWVVTTIAGSAGVHGDDDGRGSAARFYSPTGIALDAQTNLYVADTANFTIRQIRPMGSDWEVTTIAGTPLDFDFIDGINQDARFDFPYGITLGAEGMLFVTDSGNHAIRQLAQSGEDWIVTTIAGLSGNMGSADGPGGDAQFNTPNGITLENASTLLVSDQYNDTLRRVAWTGTDWVVSTVGGVAGKIGSAEGLGTNALFFRPWDVAMDKAGNIYVTDQRNSTIRQGTPVVIGPPRLDIALMDGQLVISWPASAAKYGLEASRDLAAPAWSPVTNEAVVVGESLVVTNRPPAATVFYRLTTQ